MTRALRGGISVSSRRLPASTRRRHAGSDRARQTIRRVGRTRKPRDHGRRRLAELVGGSGIAEHGEDAAIALRDQREVAESDAVLRGERPTLAAGQHEMRHAARVQVAARIGRLERRIEQRRGADEKLRRCAARIRRERRHAAFVRAAWPARSWRREKAEDAQTLAAVARRKAAFLQREHVRFAPRRRSGHREIRIAVDHAAVRAALEHRHAVANVEQPGVARRRPKHPVIRVRRAVGIDREPRGERDYARRARQGLEIPGASRRERALLRAPIGRHEREGNCDESDGSHGTEG